MEYNKGRGCLQSVHKGTCSQILQKTPSYSQSSKVTDSKIAESFLQSVLTSFPPSPHVGGLNFFTPLLLISDSNIAESTSCSQSSRLPPPPMLTLTLPPPMLTLTHPFPDVDLNSFTPLRYNLHRCGHKITRNHQ